MRLILSVVCLIVMLSSCHNTKENNKINKYSLQGERIVISEDSPLLQKIETQIVSTENYSEELSTSGTIKAIPNKYAEIAAPFAGRITKSFIRLGQRIKKNDPIFEINSPDFFEASKVYFQAKQEMQLAKKNLKRQQDLTNNGVGIQKDLEESEVNFAIKERDFENAKLSLKVFQVSPKNLVLGQALIIRSPIDGEIIDNNIVIGQYIKEDEEPVALVSELDKVWIVGQVKEKDINKINIESDVNVCLTAISDKNIKAKIYHISDILDEETRSVKVYIECDNSDRIMKPGMYVRVNFIHTPKEEILIPSSSVLQMEDNNYVFVEVEKNAFIKRNITTKTTNTNKLIVLSGLKKGEKIVSSGSYFLMEAK